MDFSLALERSYDCSHSYRLTLGGSVQTASSSPFCQGSCLQSNPALSVGGLRESCTSLLAILQLYNGVIEGNDCLELSFSPGEYRLSSLSLAEVRYSVILRAPWGGVTLSCGTNAESMCEGQKGGGVMMAFNGSQLTSNTFVIVDLLSFQYCSKKLQFNALEELRISNSSFM